MQLFQGRSVVKILQSNLFLWSTIPALVLGILILVYFSSVKDFTVFPNQDRFHYTFYTDSSIGGNSEIISQVVTDRIIQIDYELKNGINSPFIGLSILPIHDPFLQFASFNQLTVKVKGSNTNNMGIALYTANPYPASAKQSPEISFYTIINISSTINTYSINLNQFKVPDWWYELNNISDATSKKPDLKNLTSLNITNAYSPNKGEKQSLEIYSITFSRNNKPLLIQLLLLELVVIFLTFSFIYSVEKIRGSKKSITITYKSVESNSTNAPKSDFIDFINTNFQNSELTMEFVSRETGVSPRRITNDIQNQFFCNFKSYINRLRINESKRLLLEKELNIGEIAFRVGFNSQTHFNRVFKSEVQISPTEYRDKFKNQ